jgi:phosphoglycolate phosphatase
VIRGLIFDLDGTLVDSLPGIAASINNALREEGLPTHSTEAVEGFIGNGARALVELALGKETHRTEEILASFHRHYAEDWKSGTLIYPGMLELLEDLHAGGYPLAVLSNKPHQHTSKIVETLFPDHLFDQVMGHQEAFPKKPDPTMAHHIIDKWNLPYHQVAYVGDSTVDLATAQNGNLIPLIFSWGYGTPKNIPLLHTIEDLKDKLQSP